MSLRGLKGKLNVRTSLKAQFFGGAICLKKYLGFIPCDIERRAFVPVRGKSDCLGWIMLIPLKIVFLSIRTRFLEL